tara:strand:+ start:1138 stop:3408 length:2271 start_codon:yes stop_codon:yes gene_type:complete
MNKKAIAVAISLAATSSAILFSGHVIAQGLIEEVVVTAQKRSQSAQDVPIALNAFGEDMLRQMGASDFRDLTTMTPGLSVGGGNDAFPAPYIRGIGTNDNGIGSDPSVGIYIDGVYASRKGGALSDLVDVQRVEVLKGPQGTLFGRNSIGGAISIVTQKPDTEAVSGLLEGELGNYDSRVAKGLVNVPLIEDSLALRVSGVLRKRDGWQENVIDGNEGGKRDRASTRLRLLWNATDSLELDMISSWEDWDDTTIYADALIVPDSPPVSDVAKNTSDRKAVADGIDLYGNSANNQGPLLPILDRTLWQHSMTLNWDINDWLSFTSLTAYRTYDTKTAGEYEGTEYLVAQNEYSKESSDSYSQEFRLSGATDSIDWFVGVSGNWEENSMKFTIAGADPTGINGLNPFAEDSFVKSETDSYAVFGDAIWHVTDLLNVTFGARYSYDDKRIHYENPFQEDGAALLGGRGFIMPIPIQFVDEAGNVDTSLTKLDESWDDFSPRLVVDYAVLDDAMVYASITRGYKAGAFNTYPSVITDTSAPNLLDVVPAATEPVDPEIVTNYELGFKSTLLDGNMTLNAALYYFDYEDLQVFVINGFVTQLDNAGKASSQGLDFDMTWHLSPSWTLIANGAYMDSKYDDFVSGDTDYSGQSLLYSPDFSGSLAVDYHVAMFGGEFRTYLAYAYKGDHYIDPDYEEGSYSTLSGRMSWLSNDDTWELALYGSNLTDEAYLVSYIDQGQIWGFVGAQRNAPRTYGASVTYRF